ncbi:RNA-directed DNA polymerase, eukaryota [Tanacetum coccineum]
MISTKRRDEDEVPMSEKNANNDDEVDLVQDIVFDDTMQGNNQGDGVKSEHLKEKSEDPFGLYALLNKVNRNESNSGTSIKFPPGFTPLVDKEEGMVNMNFKDDEKGSSNSGHFKKSGCPRTEGSILGVLEEVVKVGLAQKTKKDWVRELCIRNKVNFLAIQETKMELMDELCVRNCWGNMQYDHAVSDAVGNSGGILCIWDPNCFSKESVTISDFFVIIRGTWRLTGQKFLMIAVYAPQDSRDKITLWDFLHHEISKWKGESIVMGDFNEVRFKSDRFGSNFNVNGAYSFNSFISRAGLVEVVLGGCRYTWSLKNATKMSKLDRFLVSENLLISTPHLNAITLERYLSDHRPILLKENYFDYGPTPFRFFHHWIGMEGFSKLVEDTWKSSPSTDENAMKYLFGKFKHLKNTIREWTKNSQLCRKNVKTQFKKDLEAINQIIDSGKGSEEDIQMRSEIMLKLRDCDEIDSVELAQKAKIKWAIEGDENSKFYHGMLNKKRNNLSIRGVLVDGVWVDDPKEVKKEFFEHFSKRFAKPGYRRAKIRMEFPKRLSSDQMLDMEMEISKDEVKRAVWDCGTDKAPGLDGFTFGFFRHFWYLVGEEVFDAIPDANGVKDFRPISLIGSIYKIIAKILANRLVNVLEDLVNDVQSAFVINRQILDGPFMINEILQWCKMKKKETLIFKVDFEKAYDSVRWDFLDEVLSKFGFGEKWRKWIQCCLHSSRGSIIINGSPTEEFNFGKGLKQGDPLSPFLFILIMESLHLSFQRVVDEGYFHGIKLHDSVNISHLFYADDVVFVGYWSNRNISTRTHVLECFYLAFGIKINMSKSKIMGIHVNIDNVNQAAENLGCLVLKIPFMFLGSIVGGNMHRLSLWKDMIDRVKRRLSKWKMKMLSIGGRLTLVKSVLGSMPIFQLSLFKAPSGILKTLESIRRNFFNGLDGSSKKISWVNWNKVIAPKDKGGLGVSSLYALNRSLLFKWIWRFLTQGSSLWARVIKAIHGEDGNIGSKCKGGSKSCWSSIVSEVKTLENKGIDLMQFLKIKIGNGDSIRLWEDPWHVDGILKVRFPRIYALELRKSITIGEKLGHHNLSDTFRRCPRGGVEQLQFDDLVTLIQKVSIAPIADRWAWTRNSSGEFTVASARQFIDVKISAGGEFKTSWIRYIPNKVNIHAWKVMSNALATKFNMSRRGIPIDSITCVNCGTGVENTNHLFFTCDMAQKVSHMINRWWDIQDSEVVSYSSWKEWVTKLRLPGKNKLMFEGVYNVMWWLLWWYRSKVPFSWNEWLKNPNLINL